MANQITWGDKDKSNVNGVNNRWRDEDANMVKAVVNAKQDAPPAGKRVVIRCGDYNATSVQFPTAGGTGDGGAILMGNKFRIVTGSVNTDLCPIGCDIEALVDNPSGPSDWRVYY